MKGNWASSAKLHENFGSDNISIEKAMADYGVEKVGVIDFETRTPIADVEHLRRCKTCSLLKEISKFSSQVKNGKTYYLKECKECAYKKRSGKAVGNEVDEQLMADAPFIAAMRLLDQEPKALALLIKHFRNDFQKLYEEEKKRIQSNPILTST